MRIKLSTVDPSQTELDALPRLPLLLRRNGQQLEVVGLLDSAATVNVLPYTAGLKLGGDWDDHKANLRLAGNLGNLAAMPLFAHAQVADYSPVKLASAWLRVDTAPVILGQTNFFMEFDVCFYRSALEFEIRQRK